MDRLRNKGWRRCRTFNADPALVFRAGPSRETPLQHVVNGEGERPLDLSLMAAAVERILLHHDALRLRYERDGDAWRQWHAAPEESGVAPVFTTVDMSDVDEREQSAAIEKAAGEFQASLDLARGPIIRVVHFNLGAGQGARLFRRSSLGYGRSVMASPS
jgi:hypothetical protein